MDKKYGNVIYSFSENEENKNYDLATEGQGKMLNASSFSPANQSNQSVWPLGLNHLFWSFSVSLSLIELHAKLGFLQRTEGFYLIGLNSKICRFHINEVNVRFQLHSCRRAYFCFC